MTDEPPPRTTVVIPAWGSYVGPRLVEAVASIQAQGRRVRVLIVDNSSDVTIPQLDAVEVLRTPARVSVGAARNVGLERVSSPNVLFWDADDLMLPGTLALLEDRLTGDRSLVACGAAIIDERSGLRHRWPRPWLLRLLQRRWLFALGNCTWSSFPATGATLMRTDTARACGGFADANGGEDWCLGAALAFRGRLSWSEHPGRSYPQHPDSLLASTDSWRQQLQHAAMVRRWLRGPDRAPGWLRVLLPLIALAQWSAVTLSRVVAALRRLRTT